LPATSEKTFLIFDLDFKLAFIKSVLKNVCHSLIQLIYPVVVVAKVAPYTIFLCQAPYNFIIWKISAIKIIRIE
jgi:hypothetical protein